MPTPLSSDTDSAAGLPAWVADVPSPSSPLLLAGMLTVTGLTHLCVPRPFYALIPAWLPGPRKLWNLGAGIAELSCALGLATPRTRRPAAWATAGLFVGVFPGNLWMAWKWRSLPWPLQLVSLGRLPLQLPLIAWALKVARSPRR